MVVLNFFGKISPICISEKLKLYISNLPNEDYNEWRDEIAKHLSLSVNADLIYQQYLETDYPNGIINLYKTVFPERPVPASFGQEQYIDIADHMICVYQDYSYDDMPLGGWETNCFDGRLCEEDYSEKIIDLINFLSYYYESPRFPQPTPQWIYSSNHDGIDHFRIFWGTLEAEKYIESLKSWGKLFDQLLHEKNDFLLFDYLVNSIHKDHEYNEYHLMKAYSLCQLFLEKEHEWELDSKLPQFIDDRYSNDEKKQCALLLRQLRNKIAHGDFVGFEAKIEEFATVFMDNSFDFDYSEYSRKNWAIQHVCCLLDEILREIMYMLFYNREQLKEIKKQVIPYQRGN